MAKQKNKILTTLHLLCLLLLIPPSRTQTTYPTKNPCKDTQTPNALTFSSQSSTTCTDCSTIIRNCKKCYPTSDEENKKYQENGGCIDCYTSWFKPPTKEQSQQDLVEFLKKNSINSNTNFTKTGPVSRCRLTAFGWISLLGTIFGVLACVGCCCCMCSRKNRRMRHARYMHGGGGMMGAFNGGKPGFENNNNNNGFSNFNNNGGGNGFGNGFNNNGGNNGNMNMNFNGGGGFNRGYSGHQIGGNESFMGPVNPMMNQGPMSPIPTPRGPGMMLVPPPMLSPRGGGMMMGDNSFYGM